MEGIYEDMGPWKGSMLGQGTMEGVYEDMGPWKGSMRTWDHGRGL